MWRPGCKLHIQVKEKRQETAQLYKELFSAAITADFRPLLQSTGNDNQDISINLSHEVVFYQL